MIIVVLFLFILPAVAVMIGSKITEWWVIPTINTDDILKSPEEVVFGGDDAAEEDTQEEINNADKAVGENSNEETVDLNSMSIYMIQVASISDNKNIESLTEELANHNLPHIVYGLDNTYKIYTFASTNRQDMEGKIDRVRGIYEDAYIHQIHVPQKQIQYSSKENKGTKEVIGDMNLLLELLKQSSDSLNGSENEKEIPGGYKEVLEDYQKLLDQMFKNVSDADLPKGFAGADDIKRMIEYHEKNITESLKIIEEKQGLYRLQNYFLDNIFKTIEVIGK